MKAHFSFLHREKSPWWAVRSARGWAASVPARTFAVVTIGVLADGVDLKRIDDKTYR